MGTEGPLNISDSILTFAWHGDAVPKVHVNLEIESGATISELQYKIYHYQAMKVIMQYSFLVTERGIIDIFGNPSMVSLIPCVLLTSLLCWVPSMQCWLGG